MALQKHITKADPEIVIIGAGIAGISAAHHLYVNGFRNIKILEASDRIGGRINTVKFGHENDSLVELGANWIHGADDKNPVFKLANSHGLLTPFVLLDRMEGTSYTEDGRPLSKQLVDKAFTVFETVNAEMDTFYQKGIKTQQTCLDFMITRLKEVLDQFDEADRNDVWSLFNCMLNYLSFHCGQNLGTLSLQLMGNYEEIRGSNAKLPFGYRSVLDTLLKDLPSNILYFNKVVNKIQWLENGEGKQVKIFCNHNKEAIEAHHVIVTISLGVLKEMCASRDLFDPALPENKIKAVESMGFGTVNKIFLYFDKPFWKVGEGSIKPTWSGDNSQVSRDTWFKHMFAFDEVLNNSHVLVAWMYGDAAEYMENMSDEDVLRSCHNLICKFTNNKTVPYPSKLIRSEWQTNPFTRGSYSFFQVKSQGNEPQVIGEPLFDNYGTPVVMFAGEATHPKWFSTTHGARATGIREAERLVMLYQSKNV